MLSRKVSCDLVIDHNGLVIETGVRVFDERSLIALLTLLHARSFGLLACRKFLLRLPSGGGDIRVLKTLGLRHVHLSKDLVAYVNENLPDFWDGYVNVASFRIYS